MKKRNIKVDFYLIFFVSLIMSLPQFLGRGMIIGSDSIFHFNRFYDTAMQIREGNFQYFISMYGFQGSGRIVNALYGPLTAYFHGLLVSVSQSWHGYQILANFILFLLAGSSMYFFLKKGKIASHLRLPVSILYMTTYSVQYWTTRQGFSSWGAALLPFCLIPFIEMMTEKKINNFQLGICTALMIQTHLFSSLLLVLIYIPAFIYVYSQSHNRKRLLIDLCISVLVFFALTANIWFGFFEIYGGNEILAPFVNQTMSLNTINSNSSYWLWNPVSLVFILLFELFHVTRRGKEYTALHKMTLGIGSFFLILSTSLVPWTYLVSRGNALVELIQFPFRFFVPCTVLFLFSFCLTLQELHLEKQSEGMKYLIFVVVASVIQVLVLIGFSMYQWHQSESVLLPRIHMSIQTSNEAVLKASFFDSDLSKSLKLVEKSTPDYLPIYSLEERNMYDMYKEEIIDKNPYFHKKVKDKKLIVSWQGEKSETIQVPIIKYAGTHLVLNGQALETSQMELTSIGAVSLIQKEGGNMLEVTYMEKPCFKFFWFVTLISWGLCLLNIIKRKDS